MTACTKLYLQWSFSLCLITGVTACLTSRQTAASLTACLYHVPSSMTTCTDARLWREIYRKWGLAFEFCIEKPREECKESVQSIQCLSQIVSGYLEVFDKNVCLFFLFISFRASGHRLLKVLSMYFLCLFCKSYQRNRLREK